MRIALVTAPPEPGSRAGALAAALLPALRERAEVRVHLAPGLSWPGLETVPAPELRPREHDHVLLVVANEPGCAFLAPLARAVGGTAVLLDWRLPELARAAWPSLDQPGLAGLVRAFREGGAAGVRSWRETHGMPLGAGPAPTWNRSIVRFADAFLVPDAETAGRVLDSRNAPTPVEVVPCQAPADEPAARAAAARWLECLEGFPQARATRRSLAVQAWQGRAGGPDRELSR